MNWDLLGLVILFYIASHAIWVKFFKTKVSDWSDNKTYVQYDNGYCWARQEYDSGRLTEQQLVAEILDQNTPFNKGAAKFLQNLKEKSCV